jgi:PAS domain S-box-containing protein
VPAARRYSDYFLRRESDERGTKRIMAKKKQTGAVKPKDQRENVSMEAQQSSDEKYRSLTNQLPVGVYRTTVGGNLVYMNPALVKMLGFGSEEELLHTNVNDLYVNISDRYEQLKEAQGSSEVIRREFQLRKKDGEYLWVRDNSRLLFNSSGEPEYFDGILEDITESKRTEEVLKEKEIVYRTLFEGANDGIIILRGTNFFDCNQMAVKLYGCETKQDLIGKSPWELSPPIQPDGRSSEEKANTFIGKAIIGIPQRFYWQHWKPDGELFDVEVSLSTMPIGENTYIQAIVRDVTEAMINERRMLESEANLKAIIENSLESIWSADRRYKIKYVNKVFIKSFKRVFGVTLKKGTNILEALPEEMRASWKEKYDRAFKGEHFVFEDKIETGEQRIYIEVAVNPIVVDGSVVAASFYGKDITARKFSEMELRRQATLRQMLIEISSAYINLPLDSIEPAIEYSLGVMGKFTGADRATIFEYDFSRRVCIKTEEWYARKVSPFRLEDDIIRFEDIPELLSSHMEGNTIYLSEDDQAWISHFSEFYKQSGVISLIAVPMMSNNNCIGFIGFNSVCKHFNQSDIERELLMVYSQILVNIRLRKEAEEELIKAKEKAEESDHLKSAFLANMSHEIRTPMNGILGFLELLKAPDLTEENKSAYLDIVSRSGERLLDTINDIIEISRIESGEMQIKRTEVSIDEVMDYYHAFFVEQTKQKDISYKLVKQIPAEVSLIYTDRVKLESIISNLLKNAIKFTSTGHIDFGNYLDGESIVFYVKDTGQGIRPDRLEVIFHRFVQADLSHTRPHEGSGLGLSIVKAYIELLGGKIWVESEIEKGSTFYFSLPLRAENRNMVNTR